MKKIIFSILFLLFIFGCGGVEGSSNEIFSPEINISNLQTIKDKDGNILELKGNMQLKENNTYYQQVVFSSLKIDSEECEINSSVILPTTIENNQIGSFDITFSQCSDINSLEFSGVEKGEYIDTDIKTKTETFLLNIPIEIENSIIQTLDISQIESRNYTKLIIDPQSMDIISPSQEKVIKLITVDQDNYPVSKTIKMPKLLDGDKEFGVLDNYVVTTNNIGEAYIKYTATSNIDSFLGKSEYITFKIEDDDIEKNITLNFKEKDEIVQNVDKLVIEPYKINVISSSMSQIMKIVALDDENNTLANVSITIPRLLYLDENSRYLEYGVLDKYNITTDEKGEAFIQYTAPSDISNLYSETKNINLFVNNELKSTIEIKFPPAPETGKEIAFFYVLPNKLQVNQNQQEQIFKFITIDKDNKPIQAKIEVNKLLYTDSDNNTNEYGTFNSYTVITDEKGEGYLTYTAPSDISEFKDKELNMTFSAVSTTGKETLKQIVPIFFNTKDINPYKIEIIQPTKVAVDNISSITVNIAKDDGTLIEDENVKKVTLNVLHSLLTLEEDEYDNTSSKSITIKTGISSGIEILEINATVEYNGNEYNISKQEPIVIQSGDIADLSINYLKTIFDSANGVYVDTYAIHAIDKYSNPAKAGSRLYVGLVNGWKVANDDGIIGDKNSTNTEFNVTDENLSAQNVESKDTLAILFNENRLDEKYLGGWIIDSLVDDNQSLLNGGGYNIGLVDKLSYVIGNNKRYDKCAKTISLADIDSTDGTYSVNEEGYAYVRVTYDPRLIGKTITLYANTNSENSRLGISSKVILRGLGINEEVNPYIDLSHKTGLCEADNNEETCTFIFNYSASIPVTSMKLIKENFQVYNQNNSEKNCSISVSKETDCDGNFEVNVTAKEDTSCFISWKDDSIPFEY